MVGAHLACRLVGWSEGGIFLVGLFCLWVLIPAEQISSFSSPLVDVARKKGQGMSNGGIRSSELSH